MNISPHRILVMATVSLHPPLKPRDRRDGSPFSNTSTSPRHNYHHCPLPTSTNCPTSPYHRPTSPYHRSTSPFYRPTSPYNRSTSPNRRPTSPCNRSTSPHRRPTSPCNRPTSPHRRPTSPCNRSTSPHRQVSPRYHIGRAFPLSPPSHSPVNPSSPEHLRTAKPHPQPPKYPSKNLQCALCMKEYQDARILPCFHTFCADCLEISCVNKGDKLDSVYCPICMDVSELTAKGVRGLPKNTYVENLQELRGTPPPPRLKCDLCVGYEIAVKRCEKCNYNLCEFCMHAHQKQRKTSCHRLVGLERDISHDQVGGACGAPDPEVRKVVYCEAHLKQELVLYCEECKVPMCNECASSDGHHLSHHFLQLDDANHQYSEVLLGLLARAKPLIGSMNESVKNIDFVMSNIQERAQAVSEGIIESISSHVRALQEHKRSLLLQLDAIKKQKEGTLNVQVTHLREILEELNYNYNVVSKSLMDAKPLVAFSSRTPAASKLEEMLSSKEETSPKEDDYIQFHSEVPAQERNDFRMFGVLDPRGPSAANTTAEGDGLYEAREGKSAQFKVTVYDRFKQRRELGRDKVEASMTNGKNETVYMSIKDCEDGSCVISYTPDFVGEHHLSVLVEGKNIRCSPFLVNVLPRLSHHRGIYHCCTFCSSEGKKHIRCGCGGTMPGGYSGCGHGHPGHPGRHHWSCCGNQVEKSECL